MPFLLQLDINVDDDVVEFTQKGGWRKIDKLLPLAYQERRNVLWRSWGLTLDKLPDTLQVGEFLWFLCENIDRLLFFFWFV